MNFFANIRDVARLERELKAAQERAVSLEQRLEDERTRHLAREDDLINKFLQKQGSFGIQTPSVVPRKEPEKPGLPKLNAVEQATLEAFEQAAKDAGRPVIEGTKYFWAKRNGQPLPSEIELPENEFEWRQA